MAAQAWVQTFTVGTKSAILRIVFRDLSLIAVREALSYFEVSFIEGGQQVLLDVTCQTVLERLTFSFYFYGFYTWVLVFVNNSSVIEWVSYLVCGR